MGGKNPIYKYTLSPYDVNDHNAPVAHYCSLCRTHHTIPRKDWVLLVRTNRITKRQVLRLACKTSVWKSGYIGKEMLQ